ncbi:TfoX-like protein [Acidovorax temperans]|uniref:TfoX-like protein n=1 Tax=Acidovorax temperans TaxID=80878 RepID=A0A543L172_9BURK|nr:TfoX/Sxy family protein [Acidovorax temperans]TQN01073.1 TfoX-like protein [Acidovorax temperans]
MATRPLSDETLHLIGALRTALAQRSDVDERTMFGCYCFFVDGKLCMGVKGEELLVRLPPDRHGEFQEMQNTRELSPGGGMQGYFWVEPNGYATRAQWRLWLDEALAYNPRAKASPRRKPAAAKTAASAAPKATAKKSATVPKRQSGKAGNAGKRHSIFDEDD